MRKKHPPTRSHSPADRRRDFLKQGTRNRAPTQGAVAAMSIIDPSKLQIRLKTMPGPNAVPAIINAQSPGLMEVTLVGGESILSRTAAVIAAGLVMDGRDVKLSQVRLDIATEAVDLAAEIIRISTERDLQTFTRQAGGGESNGVEGTHDGTIRD